MTVSQQVYHPEYVRLAFKLSNQQKKKNRKLNRKKVKKAKPA